MSVSSPDVMVRYVLAGRAVESVSVVPDPVNVSVPVLVRGEKVESE